MALGRWNHASKAAPFARYRRSKSREPDPSGASTYRAIRFDLHGLTCRKVRAGRSWSGLRFHRSTVRRFTCPGPRTLNPVFLRETRFFKRSARKHRGTKGVGGVHRYAHEHRATYQGCLSCLTCRPVHRFAVALPIKGGIVYVVRNPSWSQYLNCERFRPAFRRLLRTRGEY